MTLTLSVYIPDNQLTEMLKKEGITKEQFKAEVAKELGTVDAEEFCPGATTTVEIKDTP